MTQFSFIFTVKIKDDCKLMKNSGNPIIQRLNNTKKWYFNYTRKKCIQFYYSGYGGNANNYDSCFECKERCLKLKV